MPPAAAPADTLPHWDVSTIYPGLDSEPFHAAVADLARQMDQLEPFFDQHQIAHRSAPARHYPSAPLTLPTPPLPPLYTRSRSTTPVLSRLTSRLFTSAIGPV